MPASVCDGARVCNGSKDLFKPLLLTGLLWLCVVAPQATGVEQAVDRVGPAGINRVLGGPLDREAQQPVGRHEGTQDPCCSSCRQ